MYNRCMTTRKKQTLLFIIAAIFAAAAFALVLCQIFNATFDENATYALIIDAAERLCLFISFVCVTAATGYAKLFIPRFKGGILTFVFALAVALANFPFFAFGEGSLSYTATAGETVLYLCFCLSIGLFEETAFRAFLIPFFMTAMKNYRYSPIIALLASSGIFALSHLFNLIGGASVGATFLQVGYTFLTGCLFGALLLLTRSFFTPVIVHTLYNAGGLLVSEGMATGIQWTSSAIAVMAAASVLAGAYTIFAVLRRTVFTDKTYVLIEPTEAEKASDD